MTVRDGNRPFRDWPHAAHSRMVEHRGFRWHVQTMGSGPPLFLVHGTGASTHSFRALMPLLLDHFALVAVDLPGHGFSEAPRSFVPTLPAMAEALADLLDFQGIVPSVAIGHSAGAAILARLTLDRRIRPELLVGIAAAMVPFRGVGRTLFPASAKLLSAANRWLPMTLSSGRSVELMLRSTGSRLPDDGLELYRRLSERPAHVAGALSMMASWNLDQLFSELPRLDTDMLLLVGELDLAVSLSAQREVQAQVPSAKLEVVKSAGHLLHEECPRVVARIILAEYASRLGAGRRS